MENKKYYNIEKKSLADAINFLTGLRYFKFTGDTGITLYGFEDTEEFKRALEGLLKLRQDLRSYK